MNEAKKLSLEGKNGGQEGSFKKNRGLEEWRSSYLHDKDYSPKKRAAFNLAEVLKKFPRPNGERVRVRGSILPNKNFSQQTFRPSRHSEQEAKQLRSEEVELTCHCERPTGASQSQSFDGGKPLTRICKFAEGSLTNSSLSLKGRGRKIAFTLAEVLITLGIIGVVAAVTMPIIVANIQDRVRTEQVRSAKYKLTLATDKMKSLGLLLDSYSTTEAFVAELQNHFKIAKVCKSNELRGCWPSDTISTPDGEINVNSITNGSKLKSLGLGTAGTATVGIITGDGVPMIMTYSPQCSQLEPSTTFSWTSVDGKPVTNATTNCISAIFDINGSTGPNRIGKDVRTLNSLFGYKRYGATPINKAGCEELKKKGLVNDCSYDSDYYAGAVKACNDIGMHLPSFQTLAVIAGAR